MRSSFTYILLLLCALLTGAQNPKREFRGAWLHTVFQDGYLKRSADENRQFLRDQLDKLQAAGINTVIFQVRPQADAFYPSKLEPWSRFISSDGSDPGWDPLQFVIDEAHSRGMDLHAWLNPYRVTSARNQTLPAGHIYHSHRDWFVRFDGKIYFDPGLPECRQFIVDVVSDIISRYDVDGIHFDDYFYPYPVKGVTFDDVRSYKKYGTGMNINDWRRHNVDQFIEDVHRAIAAKKPWVVFGISPFGIWRNKSSDPTGSDTRGLQNYDDLYADPLLWAENGWIDYQLPQLYWELEHKSASYITLVDWWAANARGRNLYIGQDVDRTMKTPDTDASDQLDRKIDLTRQAPSITGNCWWPGYSLTANTLGINDRLRSGAQSTAALVPEYPWIDSIAPSRVSGLRLTRGKLTWRSAALRGRSSDAVKFVIYRFDSPDEINLDNAGAILAVTRTKEWKVDTSGTYVVTALSRVNCESAPATIQVKL